MNTALWILGSVAIGLFSILWLYVAARVITRGVLRTIRRKDSERE